jgi:hypothetical protein
MGSTQSVTASARSKASAVFRVTSGNFLEQFDFFLFGFYATYIAAAFFPASSEFASLELGGVSVYLAEMATPGKKGFFTSWQSASQQVAIIVAAGPCVKCSIP